ncbi:MAG: IgGFc-binding protein [Deltaproteobacteria bacterium]|nr:IgGFc-binding protein [Deltaproteobacteria bacterium]
MRSRVRLLLAFSAGLALGCGPTSGTDDTVPDGGRPDSPTACADGLKQCDGATKKLLVCQAGQWVTMQQCPAACDVTLGCVQCVPSSTACSGNDVYGCNADGTPGGLLAHCTSACQNGHCTDPCGQAEEAKSYLGCEYWPTVTMNPEVPTTFSFAVAVANAAPSGSPAAVTITGGALTAPTTATVQAGQLSTITLPWVDELRSPPNKGSILKAGGAYHLTSDQPITVYQFNALEYVVGDPAAGTQTYSYTNDASLLLPRHVLADQAHHSNYLVMARPTWEMYDQPPIGPKDYLWYPGIFAVVGTENGTQVDITFTARTLAGSGVPQAYAPGQAASFALDAGGVLMITSANNDACVGEPDPGNTAFDKRFYCDLAQGYDLTGTEIQADRPVAVFGGHACTFVPFNKWACDHLEEQLFPVTAWGKRYVGTRAVSTTNPNLWRVLSGHDGNQLQFSPASVNAAVTLDKGQWVEFVTAEDFEVQGDQAFMLAGFMVGQDFTSQSTAVGDPAMALAVPVEQFRQSYVFLAPDTYEQSYVNVVAKSGATVLLDGTPVTGFQPVGTGEWTVAKLPIAGGTHTITSDGPDGFGIAVYGVGSYTSYMYPGGLDVKQINVPG